MANTPTDSHIPKYLRDLVDEAAGPQTLRTTFVYLKDPESTDSPGSLAQLLDLDLEIASKPARETLEALESVELDPATARLWNEFKWRVHAFITLQDVFDAPLFESVTMRSPFRLWYFYYESKHLLTESILCVLHGLYAASAALLRPFVEFSVLQLFFYRRLHDLRDYKELEAYFANGRVPTWHRMLKHAVERSDLGNLIKSRLQSTLEALSESAGHAYQPRFSPKSVGAGRPRPTIEGVFSWMTVHHVLQPVLWLYCLDFPALMCPVDVVRRFGFNPPMGLLVDGHASAVIKRALGAEDATKFQDHARTGGRVASILDFFNSQRDLTDREILETWSASDGPTPESVTAGYIQTVARLRILREAMAWTISDSPDTPDVPPIDTLSDWASIHRALSRRQRPR